MRWISRRDFLRHSSVAGLSVLTSGCVDREVITTDEPLPIYSWDGPPASTEIFSHGVASGDPLADGFVIWTRLTTEDDEVDVWWEIALDPDFEHRVQVGETSASRAQDWTTRVDVIGLASSTTHYYRFFAKGVESMTGRSRTTAARGGEHLRFGVVSCSNIGRGYFHAYRSLAARGDLDAVLHLGDYMYENPGAEVAERRPEPRRELVELDDYRTRYAFYRLDPDLQEIHRQHPFIPVWDDHESANNAWKDGAGNHDDGEGEWADRKAAAQQAWFEWMPVRDRADRRIWRAFRFGDLVDLLMLDTRLWGRDAQSPAAEFDADDRTILGDDQEEWFLESLRDSETTWRIVGQQVMMGQLKSRGAPLDEGGGLYINPDQWDGYQASRSRFFDVLESGVEDVTVLTGDIHSSWANELVRDPNNPDAYDPDTSRGSLAVEFVCPGVTSRGLSSFSPELFEILAPENPHVKYIEPGSRGFIVLDVTAERIQADFFHFEDISTPEADEMYSASRAVYRGKPGLVSQDAPAASKDETPEPAP